MNIALGFFGLAYSPFHIYKKPPNLTHKVDFRYSVINYYDNLIKPLRELGNVDIYGSTWRDKGNTAGSAIKASYNTEVTLLEPYKQKSPEDTDTPRNLLFRNLCENLIKSPIDYDWYVLTRWDLFFHKEITEFFPKHTTKVSLLFETPWAPQKAHVNSTFNSDDNFYIVPGNLIKKFAEVFIDFCETPTPFNKRWDPDKRIAHAFGNFMEFNNLPVNFIDSEKYLVDTNPYYSINRIVYNEKSGNYIELNKPKIYLEQLREVGLL